MNKFKVGDTVKITREEIEDDIKYIGIVAEITEIKYTGWYCLKNVDIVMIESQLELVKPKDFSKADMQDGQLYKTRDGEVYLWCKDDENSYDDDLYYSEFLPLGRCNDIIEVYPMNLTPIWKREEPKYRVKTELTKEQAEKLGLEFCEEVE